MALWAFALVFELFPCLLPLQIQLSMIALMLTGPTIHHPSNQSIMCDMKFTLIFNILIDLTDISI